MNRYPREEIKDYWHEGTRYNGYACFDAFGHCTQFVVRGYDARYPDWHYPIPFDGQEWLERVMTAWLLDRLLTVRFDALIMDAINNEVLP